MKLNKAFGVLIFIIIAITVAMLLLMWFNLSDTIETLAKKQIKETTEKAETKLNAYFNEVRTQLIEIKELTDNGKMDAEFNTDMNYYLFPIFKTSPQITTFALARTNGDEFSLIREDSTWLNNFVYETDSGMNIHRERWKGDYQIRQIVKKWEDFNAGYDPRTRDWFKGASEKGSVVPYWTEPYKILFQTFPGITLAMKAKSKKTGEYNIVQWDILLSEISKFTENLAFSKNGRVFLLSDKFELLGLPKDDRFVSDDSLKKYVLTPYDSARYQPMSVAVKLWQQGIKQFDKAYSFKLNGNKWWGYMYNYQLDNGRYFIIGVVVPESDFLYEVKKTRAIILGCSIVILIFLLIIAKGYFDKRKANRILFKQKQEIEQQKEEIEAQRDQIEIQKNKLELQNEELTQAKEEIETQRDEIEVQRDMVTDQKEKIELIHYELSQSIDYATRLQTAIFPNKSVLNEHLSEYFVFFKPKDKVSGDFYWWTYVEGHTIITAADCTGHGVPGAFMSMLGVSFLREIVKKEYITHSGVILRKLRKEIIKALKQTGQVGEQKDGMDMSLVSINHETNIAQFSGANNPLYLVRSIENFNPDDFSDESLNSRIFESDRSVLIEIKGDKMPIAIYEKMDKFSTREVKLISGDKLYMFSDGFPDQFGGPKGKKFKYKPLKQLFVDNFDISMQEQKTILDKTLTGWKGNLEQVDDIVIVGLKI